MSIFRIRRVTVGVLFAAAAASLAACGGASSTSQSTTTSPPKSTFASTANFTVGVFSGPYLVWAGVALNMFSNLHVKFVTVGSGPAELPLVSSGQMAGIDDLGAPPLSIAYARQVGLKIVWFDGKELDRLVVSQNITQPSQLAGKTIAEPTGSIAQYLLDAYLTRNGVSPSSVNVIDMDPGAMPAAFKAGEISGALIWAPAYNQMLAAGGKVLFATTDPDFLGLSGQFVSQHPRAAKALVCDWASVHHAFFQNPQHIWDAIAKETGEGVASVQALLPKVAVAPTNQTTASWLGNSETPSQLAPFMYQTGQWLLHSGAIPTSPTLGQVQASFDPSYAQNVAAGQCAS